MTYSCKIALAKAYKKLYKSNINSASLDAELLLSFTLKKSREHILAHPEIKLNERQVKKFNDLIAQRAKHVPLAYLTKEKEFYGRKFYVDERVLVPRPETEIIIDELRMRNYELGMNANIIDIGTGSGCIIITLAKELNILHSKICNLQLFATDISQDALAVAKKNARMHGVDKKIKFLHGNLLEPFIKSLGVTRCALRDLVVTANLPYLDSDMKNLLKSSNSQALKYEPRLALDGGADGLNLYRELSDQVKQLIKLFPKLKITLLCEIGETHGEEIKKIFSFAKNVEIKKDLAGLDRISVIKF
ncbi:MAG: peptide chain release factor N(5)-glutamine methyltransferase [bacterium]|nr:peptide chain release factor N(5)-glutamine methyltransferase [bacterium]